MIKNDFILLFRTFKGRKEIYIMSLYQVLMVCFFSSELQKSFMSRILLSMLREYLRNINAGWTLNGVLQWEAVAEKQER